MSTRGLMGFRIDGIDRASYNHSDSYPEGLGVGIIQGYNEAVKRWGLDEVKNRVRNLEVLNQDVKPTPEQIEKLKSFSNTNVSEMDLKDPYCLLHECQGDILKTLESGAILNGLGFIRESLFCEWAYFLNLDTMRLEIYRGFQRAPHEKGRFAQERGSNSEFYPCALIAEFALDDIPENWTDIVNA
jgi:hypothetical protein